MERGVIVGADAVAEWLLPWWWKNYSAHCSYPVAFFDFGMTDKGRNFCKEKGICFSLDIDVASYVRETEPDSKRIEVVYGEDYYKHRMAWFKKPFACLKAPFETSVWIDLDCRIQGDIAPIFEVLQGDDEIGLMPDTPAMQRHCYKHGLIEEGEVYYNSGVIVFKKGAQVIQKWVEIIQEGEFKFPGDQDALSTVFYIEDIKPATLSSKFNWPYYLPLQPGVVIVHYMGEPAKELIRQECA